MLPFHAHQINLKINKNLFFQVYTLGLNSESLFFIIIKIIKTQLRYYSAKVECLSLTNNDWPSSADIVSQQPCVEEETLTSGASAADSTVGTTAADSDKSEHRESQGDDMKETTQSEAESSSKKGMSK